MSSDPEPAALARLSTDDGEYVADAPLARGYLERGLLVACPARARSTRLPSGSRRPWPDL